MFQTNVTFEQTKSKQDLGTCNTTDSTVVIIQGQTAFDANSALTQLLNLKVLLLKTATSASATASELAVGAIASADQY